MNAISRTLRFAVFTLVEYVRSGRVLVEVIATVVAFYLLLWRWTFQNDYFFSTVHLFVLALTVYTTSAILNFGNRPQGYIVLARQLGRSGYLLGLYLAALAVELGVYVVLSVAAKLVGSALDLSLGQWLLGSVPLVLNVALIGALLTLLAPMVLPSVWRLVMLAIVAIAFSGSLLSGQTLASLNERSPALALGLSVLRTVFSTPLLPAFTGYSLSVTRDYGGSNIVIPVAQLFLAVGLVVLALYAFARREIVFTGN